MLTSVPFHGNINLLENHSTVLWCYWTVLGQTYNEPPWSSISDGNSTCSLPALTHLSETCAVSVPVY